MRHMPSTFSSGDAKGVSISPLAIQYLGDVYDHIESVIASTEAAIASCEQLEDYVFNMLSWVSVHSKQAWQQLKCFSTAQIQCQRDDEVRIPYAGHFRVDTDGFWLIHHMLQDN